MENLDPQRFWNRGVPLSDAWLETKNKTELSHYRQMSTDEARAAYRYTKWREIAHRVVSGKLIAVGIRIIPSGDAPIEIIPPHIFGLIEYIDFMGSSLGIHGINYIEIRVSRYSKPRAVLVARPKQTDGVVFSVQREKAFGPVAGGPAIVALYTKMLESGNLKGCVTIKSIQQKMVPILVKDHQNFPLGRGLSYPSFARALAPVLKRPKG